MTNDDDTPATKGDLKRLGSELRGEMVGIKDELRGEMVGMKDEMRGEMVGMKDEILRHFDVVAENIRHDLEGANHDEIEVLKDGKQDHEQRIVNLEQVAGMRA